MSVLFAMRAAERNDVRAMAAVKVELIRNGLRIDKSRPVTCIRNGGLWQYDIPVEQHVWVL